MSIPEMQACLARLYVDDSFRKLFYIDAGNALQEYKLTHDELHAITEIDRQMLEFFAASLKKKRRKQLQHVYPMLFKLRSEEIDRYYDRYYQLHISHRTNSVHQDALEFGTFMEESLDNAERLPPYASDLAKFERMYYSVVSGLGTNELDDRSTVDSPSKAVNLETRPKTRRCVQIALVNYDIAEIHEMLEHGVDVDTQKCVQSEYAIVFQAIPNSHIPRTLRLNGAAKTVLLLCDGRHTVSEILTTTQERLGVQGLEQGVIMTIERLVEEGVLDIR
jgi:hypothetical protein